jgi:hypothetical protein
LPVLLFAQQKNIPLNREFSLNYEANIEHNSLSGYTDSITDFTQFKPYIEKGVRSYSYYQFSNNKNFNRKHYWPPKTNWLVRKLKRESFIVIEDTSDNFSLTIDPLFNFQIGRDFNDSLNEKIYTNTRGVLAQGDIGAKFSFATSFYENQSTFQQYIDTFNRQYLVVPGQGRWKKFKLNGYDYAMANGYVSYSPCKITNIQMGHGKHFVGDGYRSLLLSDNAFNYPYLRITNAWKNISYTNLYTVFMNLTAGGVSTPVGTERLFQKKAGSFQMLNIAIAKKIQLGFFQGLIWQASDSLNRQKLNFNYFNPIIFSNALIYGLNKPINVLVGATLKASFRKNHLYAQFVADDFGAKNTLRNKVGYQLGLKFFDLLKIPNLHLQAEYNKVRPFTYAYKKVEQNYSQYNQSLAHPLGANFSEIVLFLNYRVADFFAEIRYSSAQIGKDSAGTHFGNNIFNSDNNASDGIAANTYNFGRGTATQIDFINAHIGYLVNPSTNFNIVAGISIRTQKQGKELNQTPFFYVGIRTSLTNIYYDF